jgi:hypothetical protein
MEEEQLPVIMAQMQPSSPSKMMCDRFRPKLLNADYHPNTTISSIFFGDDDAIYFRRI